ncbi:MAG: hypothetical protein U0165_00195 [Polyangiaceae bacterium]
MSNSGTENDDEAIWVDDSVASISEPLHILAAPLPASGFSEGEVVLPDPFAAVDVPSDPGPPNPTVRDSTRRRAAPPPLPKAPEIVELLPVMLERLAEGEYRDALALAERVLALDSDHIDAMQCAAFCHGELQKILLERLGPLSRKGSEKHTLPPPSAGTDPLEALTERMFDRVANGKYAAALMAAEELLQKDPQSADARECAALARSELRKLYALRLGDLSRIPVRTLRTEAPRDPDVRAVWDKVDGKRSMQDLIDGASSSTLDLLRVLYELLLEGRIELHALSLPYHVAYPSCSWPNATRAFATALGSTRGRSLDQTRRR